MHTSETVAAFEATDYLLMWNSEPYAMRIGQPAPAVVARWIAGHAASGTAWMITGDNPDAEPDVDAANQARRALLATLIDRSGIKTLPSVHRDPSGRWPDEHGLLIAGIDDGMAAALGRRLGQAAIVAVPAHGVVRLWWLD